MDKIHQFNSKEYPTYTEYRKALRESDNRYNAYKPWTDREDEELEELAQTMSVPELANHFKRTAGGIRARLVGIWIPYTKFSNFKEIITTSRSDIFLNAILDGANPSTGEILEEDSVWRHPKIIVDIQQFLKEPNVKPKKTSLGNYKYPFIKEQIKNKYDIDLVLMAGGYGFNAVEEDAKLMNREFGYKIYDHGGSSPYDMTTFPYVGKNKVIQKLERSNIKYVILSVVDHDNIIREIVNSSNEKLIGLQF